VPRPCFAVRLMEQQAWTVVPSDSVASLRLGPLCAAMDLRRLAAGLAAVSLDHRSLPGTGLLGVELPAPCTAHATAIDDSLVRGPDLVVTCQETDSWPIRVDLVWRAVAPQAPRRWPLVLDLIASVRTERLDSRPALAVQTSIPACAVLRLADAQPARFQPLEAAADAPQRLDPAGGPGCVLFRLREADLSYVEMIHPADFRGDELVACGDPQASWRLRHRLFPEPLEKGVILRARVRGLFCPRDGDQRMAAESYAAFAGSDPPLSD